MSRTVDYADGAAAMLESAQVLLDAGHEEEALKLSAGVLERNPQSEEALLQFAEAATRAEPFAWIADEQGDATHVGDLLRKIDLRAFQHHVLMLIERKAYEAALVMLSQGRRRFPDDPSIMRSIRVLKQHLEARYLKKLGNLDATAYTTDRPTDDRDGKHLLAYVDGIATLDDLLEFSPLGRFRTLRALTRLLTDEAIALTQPSGVRLRGAVPPRGKDTLPDPSGPAALDDAEPTETLSTSALRIVRQALQKESAEKPLPKLSRVPRASLPKAKITMLPSDEIALPSAVLTAPAADLSPRPRRARWVLPALGLLVVGAVAAVAFVLLRPSEAPAPATPPTTEVAVSEPEPTFVPTPAPEPASSPSYLLEVRSEPAGAEVVVGGRSVGSTPLRYELLNATEGADLEVTLQHPGYRERTVQQRVVGQAGSLLVTLERARTPRRATMRSWMRRSARPSGYRGTPY